MCELLKDKRASLLCALWINFNFGIHTFPKKISSKFENREYLRAEELSSFLSGGKFCKREKEKIGRERKLSFSTVFARLWIFTENARVNRKGKSSMLLQIFLLSGKLQTSRRLPTSDYWSESTKVWLGENMKENPSKMGIKTRHKSFALFFILFIFWYRIQ